MLKLIIKQVPFYISSFTALFLAMAQTGWLDRMFPLEEPTEIFTAAPLIGDALSCERIEGETICTSSWTGSEFPDFIPTEPIQIYQEWWFILGAFVIAGLVLGWLVKKVWDWVVE